ncbi:MAG: hypothetical protein JO065_16715 [Acidobacteria bacterium]|nr:hypothetical protein [Acidobacteriota bacterium]
MLNEKSEEAGRRSGMKAPSRSAPLQLEIVKRADGSGLLRCTRADGSVTWQKQSRHAAHFSLHDLTHYSVETSLGYRHAFFGLIAEGWEIEDTTGKGSRGALPPEALEVERIVGLFDAERSGGQMWTVEEFNEQSPRRLSAAEIQRVKAMRAELFERWSRVQPGEALKLMFEPDPRTVQR